MDQNRGPSKRYSSKPYQKGRERDFGASQVSASTAPEDVTEYILKVLAREPDSVQFARTTVYPGRSRITVTCDPTVTGRLIGKDGKTISAVRSFIRAAAGRYGKRIDIDIA